MAMAILIRPVAPAAVSVCPMLDLTDPRSSGEVPGASPRKTFPTTCASIGSPSGIAGAVGFYITCLRWIDACRMPGSPQDFFLRCRIGGGNAIACAIMIDGRASNHTPYPVASRDGIGQAPNHQDHNRLGSGVSICGSIKGPGAAGG